MKYSKEVLELIAKDSISQPDMMKKLGLTPRGRNYSLFKSNLQKLGIDVSHWRGKIPPPTTPKLTKETALSNIFILRELPISSSKVKAYAFRFKFLEDICSICGPRDSWHSKKLTNHLDHIDGNYLNNDLSNLRILCPNCHSQTETYCKRSKK